MTFRAPISSSPGDRRPEGVAIIEAPRGTLIHHYAVDDRGEVTGANLIVSTTNNNEAMNRSVTKVAIDYLTGTEITEGLLEPYRGCDPCLRSLSFLCHPRTRRYAIDRHAGGSRMVT